MRREAQLALEVAQEASDLILGVYATAFQVDFKIGDDPVTRADHEANALICERLLRAFPDVPVVAEESDPATYARFTSSEAAWFVDPLDGTREFVARNGQFAVMIGLAERGRATLAAIVAPAWNRAFVGVVGEGAWEVSAGGVFTPIHVSTRDTLAGASFVVSRSRMPEAAAAMIKTVGGAPPVPHGSSGLKGVLVATGAHDVYLHPGNAGCRWDACATEALVRAAGGECTTEGGARFDYASGEIEHAEASPRTAACTLRSSRRSRNATSRAPAPSESPRAVDFRKVDEFQDDMGALVDGQTRFRLDEAGFDDAGSGFEDPQGGLDATATAPRHAEGPCLEEDGGSPGPENGLPVGEAAFLVLEGACRGLPSGSGVLDVPCSPSKAGSLRSNPLSSAPRRSAARSKLARCSRPVRPSAVTSSRSSSEPAAWGRCTAPTTRCCTGTSR